MSAINANENDESIAKQLIQTIENLKETVQHQSERIDELEAKLDNQSQNVSGAFTKLGDIDDRVTELEESEDSQSDDTDETPTQESPETSLETVVSLPEELAQQELTTNQQRARFVAKDVPDYAKKVPAGFVIDSSTIRKVMKAKENDRPHTQTVARIMEFLDDFGKGGTEVVKRRGKKMVSFSEELVGRLNHSCCDGGQAPTPSRSVTS